MSFDIKRFSLFLKELRSIYMYKQIEVAEAVGITVQTYSKYENGLREPTISTLYSLSKFFNISPVLFFVSAYPLDNDQYEDNKFMILSILASNFEKYKWMFKRYIDESAYHTVGEFGNLKFIRKDERQLMNFKSSLFRINGELSVYKKELIKLINSLENEMGEMIKELDEVL